MFSSSTADTETLTGTLVGFDHDGDGCSVVQIADDGTTAPDEANDNNGEAHRCNDLDGDGPEATQGTAPLMKVSAPLATVQWATYPTANDTAGMVVRAFDTDTNTIFRVGCGRYRGR